SRLYMFDSPVVEPHALEFLSDKPDAEHPGDLVVIKDIGVDRIHRHRRAAGLQHHQIARLDNGHRKDPSSAIFDRRVPRQKPLHFEVTAPALGTKRKSTRRANAWGN